MSFGTLKYACLDFLTRKVLTRQQYDFQNHDSRRDITHANAVGHYPKGSL